MLPTPTMPSVLPASSLLPTMRLASQSPLRVDLSISRVRLTQASMSISACSATAWEFEPGAWTTRGRAWVAIERVSFLSRSGLFAGDENQARGVQREGRALEPAVELHPGPALRPEHRRELVGGVEADLALADQLPRALLRPCALLGLRACALEAPPPRAPAARRGIELVLDAERPATYALALLGRQRPHQLISIPGIEDEDTAGLERAPEAGGHPAGPVGREGGGRAE